MKIIFKVCPDMRVALFGKDISVGVKSANLGALVLSKDKLIYTGSRQGFHDSGTYITVLGIFGSSEAAERAIVSYDSYHESNLEWWEPERSGTGSNNHIEKLVT